MKSLNKDVADLLQSPLGSASAPSISFVGDLNTGIYSPGADQLAVATNGTGRLFVDSNGNVGIGTIAGAGKLEVAVSGNRTIGSQWDNKSILIGTPGAFSGNLGLSFDTTNGATIESAAPGVASYSVRIAGSEIQLFTASTERARIDSSGRLLVGTSTAYGVEGFSRHHYFCPSAGDASTHIVVSSTGAGGFPAVFFTKTRGASPTAQTIVQNNDTLGQIRFYGSDGVDYDNSAASINCEVDGTPGANDMPGRLVFSTTADGASSPTERMRIASDGALQIADAGNITVGTTTGTKIGTATTQKLGFYNATPVVQPTAVADATTAVDVITQLNALLAKLRTLGIIAT